MTTVIKAKLKTSDDQTNIDKYRVADNITYRISYYIQINLRKSFGIDYRVASLSKRYFNNKRNTHLKFEIETTILTGLN